MQKNTQHLQLLIRLGVEHVKHWVEETDLKTELSFLGLLIVLALNDLVKTKNSYYIHLRNLINSLDC